MSGNAMALTAGVLDAAGTPATSRVPVNLRVRCESGPVGVLPEVMTFSAVTTVGNWVSGTTRVTVNGLPAINTVSAGTGYNVAGTATGPLQVAQPSTRLTIT
jgi:hypothetical protein